MKVELSVGVMREKVAARAGGSRTEKAIGGRGKSAGFRLRARRVDHLSRFAHSTEVWAKKACAASKVSNYDNRMTGVDNTPPKFVRQCVYLDLHLVVAI